MRKLGIEGPHTHVSTTVGGAAKVAAAKIERKIIYMRKKNLEKNLRIVGKSHAGKCVSDFEKKIENSYFLKRKHEYQKQKTIQLNANLM
jgi:hypothetical protein